MLSGKDFVNGISFISHAVSVGSGLVKVGSPLAPAFISDLGGVINSFQYAAQRIFGPAEVAPFPKNFFSQLRWLGEYAPLLLALTSRDPFADARKAADVFAVKYNFSYKI